MKAAFDTLDTDLKAALTLARDRIEAYHRRQVSGELALYRGRWHAVWRKVTPLDRVGLYVPGGKAAYPSSLLMNAVPAKVAGAREVIMVVPTPDGVKNATVPAAAHLAGVDRAFTIGGAQAVARWPTALHGARGGQDRRPRQCLAWLQPSAACLVWSVST